MRKGTHLVWGRAEVRVRAAAQSTRCWIWLSKERRREVSSRQKEAGFRDSKQFKSVWRGGR